MKSSPKPKKKVNPKLSQKQKFVEYAREIKADESGETFHKIIEKIIPAKPD